MIRKWPICTLTVLLYMVLLCSIPAYAVEARADDRIMYNTVTLSKSSNGDLSIFFSVQATGKMDVIGASRVEIQRNTLTGWVTEYTFTPDNAPTIQAKDKVQHSTTLTYSPLFAEKVYRAIVTIYVKDTSGSSTKQLTSKTIIA